MDYKENDNELLFMIRDGNEQATDYMVSKYKHIIEVVINKLKVQNQIIGLEETDLYQEGMIGLLNAIDSYDQNKEAIFTTYAFKCIENKIYSALRKSTNQKNKNLNDSVSLDSVIDEDSNQSLYDIIGSGDIMDKVISEENISEAIEFGRNNLSGLALKVFELKVQEFSNDEIASKLNTDKRNVENALFRIRKKMNELKNN